MPSSPRPGPSTRLVLDHRATLAACYVGYVVQAIVNNLGPLMFLIWHDQLGISFSALGGIIAVNFGIQLLIDLVSPRIVDRVGYRISMVAAHLAAAAGLILMGTLPLTMSSPFAGLVVAMIVCAVGGGLLEVLVSPVVEACPTDNKAFHMSLLHSFYCWGHIGVVILTTLGFLALGHDRWPLLCLAWTVVPVLNAAVLWVVPYYSLVEEGQAMGYRDFARSRTFWLLVVLMLGAGASEQSMSQWASAFAQAGLGLPKAMGDLLGPALFALMMGLARVLVGSRMKAGTIPRTMAASLILCVAAYLLAALTPWAWMGLVAVGLCGFSVGVLWPGTFSLGSRLFPRGGTILFALLALGGDAGCALGPAVVGAAADRFGALGPALGVGVAFPVMMLVGLAVLGRASERRAGSGASWVSGASSSE